MTLNYVGHAGRRGTPSTLTAGSTNTTAELYLADRNHDLPVATYFCYGESLETELAMERGTTRLERR